MSMTDAEIVKHVAQVEERAAHVSAVIDEFKARYPGQFISGGEYSQGLDVESYAQEAMRTATNITDPNLRLCNWAMGLVGEATEVQDVVLKQESAQDFYLESGDFLWYITVLTEDLRKLSGKPSFLPQVEEVAIALCRYAPTDGRISFVELAHQCARLCDYVKKVAFHGKEMDIALMQTQISAIYTNFVICYMRVCALFGEGASLSYVRYRNILKLIERYPEGFRTHTPSAEVAS